MIEQRAKEGRPGWKHPPLIPAEVRERIIELRRHGMSRNGIAKGRSAPLRTCAVALRKPVEPHRRDPVVPANTVQHVDELASLGKTQVSVRMSRRATDWPSPRSFPAAASRPHLHAAMSRRRIGRRPDGFAKGPPECSRQTD